MRIAVVVASLLLVSGTLRSDVDASEKDSAGWRKLPLIKNGEVHPSWAHVGYGRFVVEGDSLRTEPDEKGLGLLVYQKERFGNCEIRVVFKTKDARSNAGVYVRIDDEILNKLDEKHAPAHRDEQGDLTPESERALMDAAEKELGPWYAVHHGYEIQICDGAPPDSRTGAVYSLAKSADLPEVEPGQWRTMVITLQGKKILVEIDGKQVTKFDPNSKDIPLDRVWYQPKREPKRPEIGYIGLQTHDPGDVVYFKEISVRPLDAQ